MLVWTSILLLVLAVIIVVAMQGDAGSERRKRRRERRRARAGWARLGFGPPPGLVPGAMGVARRPWQAGSRSGLSKAARSRPGWLGQRWRVRSTASGLASISYVVRNGSQRPSTRRKSS